MSLSTQSTLGISEYTGGSLTSNSMNTSTTGSSFASFVYTGAYTANSAGSLVDSKGNSYGVPLVFSYGNANTENGYMFYVENGVGGNNHTWTLTPSGPGGALMMVLEIHSTATYPKLDQYAAGNNVTGTSFSTPAITTTQPGIVAAWFAGATSNNIIITDTFNNILQQVNAGTVYLITGALSTNTQISAGSISDTFTSNGWSQVAASIIANWYEASAGGGSNINGFFSIIG